MGLLHERPPAVAPRSPQSGHSYRSFSSDASESTNRHIFARLPSCCRYISECIFTYLRADGVYFYCLIYQFVRDSIASYAPPNPAILSSLLLSLNSFLLLLYRCIHVRVSLLLLKTFIPLYLNATGMFIEERIKIYSYSTLPTP